MPPAPRAAAPLYPLPPAPVLDRLIELSDQFPTALPAVLLNYLDPELCPGINGAKVRDWLAQAARWDDEHAALPPLQLRSDLGEAAA